MKIDAEVEQAARDYARYCGEPWPISDNLVPRFISELLRWAKERPTSQQAAQFIEASRRK
jgi:hypothetical protein